MLPGALSCWNKIKTPFQVSSNNITHYNIQQAQFACHLIANANNRCLG